MPTLNDNKSFNKSSSDCSTFAPTTNIDDGDEDEQGDEIIQNLTSVSQRNSINSINTELLKNTNYHQKTCTLMNSMTTSTQRTRLFNSIFQVVRWKDFKTTSEFTCSPKLFEVKITTVYNALHFFIQKESDIASINKLSDSIQRYANVLLSDEMMHTELFNYMINTGKHDVVLAKSRCDQKWKRALVLEKFQADAFFDSANELDDGRTMENFGYFSILFIDSGDEELIEYKKCLENHEQRLIDLIVILPAHTSLSRVVPFALKCLLNKTHIQKNALTHKTNLDYENQFEVVFRDTFKNKNLVGKMKLFLKVVQVENIRNETEAIVELFKVEENLSKINIIDYIDNKITSNQQNKNVKTFFISCNRFLFRFFFCFYFPFDLYVLIVSVLFR